MFTWIPKNLSGRAMGVPLGCEHRLGLGGAGNPYPELCLGFLHTPGWELVGKQEKNRGKCGQNKAFPRSRGAHGGDRRE